jgi:hypothetical protein
VVGGGALGAGNLIRGAGVLPTVARTAVSGGVGGAATGFGEGEGGFEERAKDALLGGAAGAGRASRCTAGSRSAAVSCGRCATP